MRKVRRLAGRVVRGVRRRVLRAVTKPPAPAEETRRPEPRVDPMPELEPFPAARYLMLVGAIPANYGGRTASILNKCRLLKELGGVDSTIVTLNYTVHLPEMSADLRSRGLLVDGVTIVNLYDYLRGEATPADVVRHEVAMPGLDLVPDRAEGVYRYFENGVYRLYQRFDAEGRLLVRDWFNDNRARTRREEFHLDGRLGRTTYMDLRHNLPRQRVYFRADGSPYLNTWLVPDLATRTSSVERVTLFDERARPTKVLHDDVELAQHFLTQLVGSDRVFLTVESRRADRETLTFKQQNVKHLVVLHNPHLVGTGRDPARIRPSYQPMFARRDELASVVFLTNAQRADAEAHFGQRENFRVVPHPMTGNRQVPFEQRDPNLVVMLARLNQQKRLSHAIDAFALVVEAVPTARLEIYGQGEDRAALQSQIDQLGLHASVTLPGYTADPGAVYERAALSLLTSRYEGYPLVLLETLAHGCPVVSYDVKYGPREIISHGENGYVVRAGAYKALARRAIEVLSDPERRRRLSEHAGTPDPEFSEHTFVARWSNIFRGLDAQGWD
jgi:glycosyltransferase involved in cell wall biosynthesis